MVSSLVTWMLPFILKNSNQVAMALNLGCSYEESIKMMTEFLVSFDLYIFIIFKKIKPKIRIYFVWNIARMSHMDVENRGRRRTRHTSNKSTKMLGILIWPDFRSLNQRGSSRRISRGRFCYNFDVKRIGSSPNKVRFCHLKDW